MVQNSNGKNCRICKIGKTYYILVSLLLLAFTARVMVFGLYDYPAYAYNYDASHHLAMAGHVYENGIGSMPAYLADGKEGIAYFHVVFPYAFSALMSRMLNMPYFNGFYFSAAAIDASVVISLFFIALALFRSKKAAFVSAALYVIPFPAAVWLSTYKYGMFTIVFSAGLAAAFLALLIYYSKSKSLMHLIPASLILMCILLTHFLEFAALSIALLAVIIAANIHHKKKAAAHFGIAFLICLPAFLYFLPRLFYVWMPIKSAGFHLAPKITSAFGFMLQIDSLFWFLPWLFLAVLGLFAFFNKKWEKQRIIWVSITLFFAFLSFILAYFAGEAEYLIKLKYLMPILLIPLVSYCCLALLARIPSQHRKCAAVSASLLFIAFSLGGYNLFTEEVRQGGLMTSEQYNFMLKVQDATPEDARIFALPGFEGWKCLAAKRVCFEVYYSFLMSSGYSGPEGLLEGIYAGHSANLPRKISILKWEAGREIEEGKYLHANESISSFDYAAMRKNAEDIPHKEIYAYLGNESIVLESTNYAIYKVPAFP